MGNKKKPNVKIETENINVTRPVFLIMTEEQIDASIKSLQEAKKIASQMNKDCKKSDDCPGKCRSINLTITNVKATVLIAPKNKKNW